MKAPTVRYAPDVDVLYVLLRDAAVATTVSLDDLRHLDYAAAGDIVGVEFINASAGVDLTGLPLAERVARLIRESGHRFPTLV